MKLAANATDAVEYFLLQLNSVSVKVGVSGLSVGKKTSGISLDAGLSWSLRSFRNATILGKRARDSDSNVR